MVSWVFYSLIMFPGPQEGNCLTTKDHGPQGSLSVFGEKISLQFTAALKLDLCLVNWIVSLDLMDAYLHIPIHQDSQRFLRVAVIGFILNFQVLIFWISIAPGLFTRINNPGLNYLQSVMRLLHGYFFDFLLPDHSREMLTREIHHSVFFLKHVGFLVPSRRISLQRRE